MQPPMPRVALGRLRFADLVREGRSLLDLTQAELAARSGVSREAIARLEANHGGLPVRDLEAVLAALDAGGVALGPDARPDLRDAPQWVSR